jgi:hypothetical protein
LFVFESQNSHFFLGGDGEFQASLWICAALLTINYEFQVHEIEQRSKDEHTTTTKIMLTLSDDDLRPIVTAIDFARAVQSLTPSVSPSELARYRAIREKFNAERATRN